MPIRLNTPRLREAAAALGDTSDKAIRARTGITVGTLSRIVNQQVEPTLATLDTLSHTYNIPVDELYLHIDDEPAAGDDVA
jgi:transcriptional regulator with XRE-family HTH domain